jgi:hypothetical protein
MIRNVVFNEYIMFTDSQTSTDSDVSDDEQQRTSMQVEHIEEKENETAKNDDVYHETQFDDIDNHFVPPSSPVLQQQSHSIAGDRPRRTIAPHKRLLKKCNIVYYAMSCMNRWRMMLNLLHILKSSHPLTTISGFLLCTKRCNRLKKMAHGILCACLNTRRLSVVSGYLKKGRFVS